MVHAIVVTYNGRIWIDKCLSSLLKQPMVSKIIVVDNQSTDQTVMHIQENYPSVHLIFNNQNLGFGKANNKALQLAAEEKADYVFLLNQDAWIKDDAVTELVSIHKNSPQYGILSPVHLRGDGLGVDLKYGMFVAQSENAGLISDLILHREKLDQVYEVKFVNAAAWLISKECLEKVGGFAPVFKHYGEDENFVHRCLFHSFKIGICPSTFIYHDRKNVLYPLDINNSEDYLKRQQVCNLIYLTNINYNFTKRFIKLVAISLGKTAKCLAHLRMNNVKTSFHEAIAFIGPFRKIWLTTRKTKRIGLTYLDTQG